MACLLGLADGIRYYDITLNFSIRYLYTEIYDQSSANAGANNPSFKAGWATWNNFYGQPSLPTVLGGEISPRAWGLHFGMYDAGWSSSLFPNARAALGLPAGFRPFFLSDNSVKYPSLQNNGGGTQSSGLMDLFYAGFSQQPLQVSGGTA